MQQRNSRGQFILGAPSPHKKQMEFKCNQCGVIYNKKASRAKETRFCGRKCCALWVYENRNKKAFMRDKSGHKNPAWKGGVQYIAGYRFVSTGKKKRQQEHRIIMEKHLGRALLRREIVHHKDGNKLNNHIGNLQLMSQSEHILEHIKNKEIGGRVSYEKGKKKIICKVCGKIVIPNSPSQKYCEVCKKKIKY